MSQTKWHQFGVGWVKNGKRGEYISAVANGERQKVKVKFTLEDGSEIEPTNFVVLFNDDKPSQAAPDVQFCFTTEE